MAGASLPARRPIFKFMEYIDQAIVELILFFNFLILLFFLIPLTLNIIAKFFRSIWKIN